MKTTVERLALIKYHFNHGIEQSRLIEPLNGFSLLTFHDTVELFLNLICEINSIEIPIQFMEYWTKINNNSATAKLSHKTSMQKLNKARVGFKHYGIIPSKPDIESFKIFTQSFLEENYFKFFDIDFNKVSLVDLIENERSQKHLKESENAFDTNSIEQCVNNLAKSFAYLLHDYESNKKDKRYQSPFDFTDSFRSLRHIPSKIDNETKRFLSNVVDSITKIQGILRLITMDIDYKQYIKFSALTPGYGFTSNDEVVPFRFDKKTFTSEDFDFCRNFIINTALKLQESDFKLDETVYYG